MGVFAAGTDLHFADQPAGRKAVLDCRLIQ